MGEAVALKSEALRDGRGLESTTPPGNTTQLEQTLAPVEIDRSFLFAAGNGADFPRAPVDERTGIPLLIAPRSDLASVPVELLSEHHSWFPRLSAELRTRGGRALRTSRIQRTKRTQHNHGDRTAFHAVFHDGPEVPDDEDTQVGLCVLALAHYLPEAVVDTSKGEPTVRTMRDWERRRFSEPGQFLAPNPKQVRTYRDKWLPGVTLIRAKARLLAQKEKQSALTSRNLHYGLDPIKSLLDSYVIEQDLSEVKPGLRRGFTERGSTEDGLSLLAIAAVNASSTAKVKGRPLAEVYQELHAEGRLHRSMPPNAGTLIKYKLGGYAGRVALLPALHEQLLSQEDMVA